MPGLGHDVNRRIGGSIFVNDFSNEVDAIQRKAKREAAERAAAAAVLSAQDADSQAHERERLRAEQEAAAKKEVADLKAANEQLTADTNRLEAQSKSLAAEKATLSSEKATLASEKRTVDAKLATVTQENKELLRGLWAWKEDISGNGCLSEMWNGHTVMFWNKKIKCAIDASESSDFMYTWRLYPGNPNQMIRLELVEWPYWKLKHHDKYLETKSSDDGSQIDRVPDRNAQWLHWRLSFDANHDIRIVNRHTGKALYVKDPQENVDGLKLQSLPLGDHGQYWRLLMVE